MVRWKVNSAAFGSCPGPTVQWRMRLEMVEFQRVDFRLFEFLVEDATVGPGGAAFSAHPPDAPEQKVNSDNQAAGSSEQ